jgi:hypothetical protein
MERGKDMNNVAKLIRVLSVGVLIWGIVTFFYHLSVAMEFVVFLSLAKCLVGMIILLGFSELLELLHSINEQLKALKNE